MPSFLQSSKASAKIFSRNTLKGSGERRQPCRCFKPVSAIVVHSNVAFGLAVEIPVDVDKFSRDTILL